MGLAPWHNVSSDEVGGNIFSGHIANGTFSVNWEILNTIERDIMMMEPKQHSQANISCDEVETIIQQDQAHCLERRVSGLAYQIQKEMEDKTLEFIAHMKLITNSSQLCFAGGATTFYSLCINSICFVFEPYHNHMYMSCLLFFLRCCSKPCFKREDLS